MFKALCIDCVQYRIFAYDRIYDIFHDICIYNTSLLVRQALTRSTNISADDTRITTLLQAILLIQNLNAPSSNASLLQNAIG